MKKWNVEDIKNVLNEIGEKFDFPCNHIPVVVSRRMTSCKGYFSFKKNIQKNTKNIIPIKFAFSDKLLDGRYDESVVRETIIHEYIHYYTNMKNNHDHGHDNIFKCNCIKAGISPNTYFTAKPNMEVVEEKRKKKISTKKPVYGEVYVARCSCCSKVVAVRVRACTLTKNPERYRSSCCKKSILISKERRAA